MVVLFFMECDYLLGFFNEYVKKIIIFVVCRMWLEMNYSCMIDFYSCLSGELYERAFTLHAICRWLGRR